MVVKMRKWSPWHVTTTTTKFEVAVKPIKLELASHHQENINDDDHGDDDDDSKCVAIRIKWKGEPKLFPIMSRPKREISRAKGLKKSFRLIQWDDDDDDDGWFKNTCSFTSSPSHQQDHNFGAWEVAFDVLYGNKIDQRAKKALVIGKVVLDIGEIAWKAQNSSVERRLSLTLQIDGSAMEATLTVLFNMAEIMQFQYPLVTNNTRDTSTKSSKPKGRRRSLSQEEITTDESDESTSLEAKDAAKTSLLMNSKSLAVSDKKEGWFSWTSKRFSFKRAKIRDDSKAHAEAQCPVSSSVDSFNNDGVSVSQKEEALEPCLGSEENCPIGSWDEKEIISRDGHTKLKASVFFASFDQCSEKAAGQGACTTLVAVISHWLHSNSVESMPNRLELDNLIMQGSSEWRKLCDDSVHVTEFPDRHFDLETVLRAGIRPLTISHEKSFVGFFGAETFEVLKGAMSFDEIWNGITRNVDGDDDATPRIYIVSWNDHFFVLKAESNAYYIIDTLGERLYEGCNRAYLLRFDDSTVVMKQDDEESADQPQTEASNNMNGEEDMVICRGKECCREFIKRFLASITLKELEEEEKKKDDWYFSVHNRLQIEFNYTCPSYPHSSSSMSSPFSSPSDTS